MTAATLTTQEKVEFEVSFKEPQAHYVEVLMRISNIDRDFIDIKMPVWAPGSYLIREFPKNVEGFQVNANTRKVNSTKIDKNTWRVETRGHDTIEASYRVYGFEISVRTSFIDASHAFLSPPGIFMFIDNKLNLPVEINVTPFNNWSSISTGLSSIEGKPNTFYAEDFDALFDSPIEVGNQDIFTFKAAGVHHEVAMVGGGSYDKNKLKEDITRIVQEQTKVYGENPNKRYVFIVHNYRSGGGGLEHRNSTVLGASRYAYNSEKGYNGFLRLVAHEYFHLWNVKRLRPVTLGPFDYSKENYTSSLWISEGFTAYYDNLSLRRCGFYSIGNYLQILADDMSAVENRAGNLVQTLSDSSFDAWIKQYRPDENSFNTTVTYYTKGAMIALLLDLQIIEATQGEKKLDDVMRKMYERCCIEEDRGFNREEFEKTASKIAGVSLDDVFKNVDIAEPIDYNRFLNYAGFEVIDLNAESSAKTLGARLIEKDGKCIVSFVLRGGGAWECGLNVGDEVIGINGSRILDVKEDLEQIMAFVTIGSRVDVLAARDGNIIQLSVEVKADMKKAFQIRSVDNPSTLQLRIRKRWLSGDLPNH